MLLMCWEKYTEKRPKKLIIHTESNVNFFPNIKMRLMIQYLVTPTIITFNLKIIHLKLKEKN